MINEQFSTISSIFNHNHGSADEGYRMSDPLPYFDIHIANQVLHARMVGKWGGAVDLAYLSELTLSMSEVRALPWVIFIDMHLCDFTEQIFETEIRFKAALDRRNQLMECWWVSDPHQGDFLTHFLEEQNIPLGRFTDLDEAKVWLARKDFCLDEKWLVTDGVSK